MDGGGGGGGAAGGVFVWGGWGVARPDRGEFAERLNPKDPDVMRILHVKFLLASSRSLTLSLSLPLSLLSLSLSLSLSLARARARSPLLSGDVSLSLLPLAW